jgi:excisionase family DNA binding protein
MLTVPEAARRANRNPETIRRWIRAGKLPARKIGTQHVIEEDALDAVLDDEHEMLPLPDSWKTTADGRPMPNVVRWIHESRRGR